MAGACPTSLSIAVARRRRHGRDGCARLPAGRDSPMGAGSPRSRRERLSAQHMDTGSIAERAMLTPKRRSENFWRPGVPKCPASAGDVVLPDFDAQCEVFLDMKPTAVSSIMGVFPAALCAPFEIRWRSRGLRQRRRWRRQNRHSRPARTRSSRRDAKRADIVERSTRALRSGSQSD